MTSSKAMPRLELIGERKLPLVVVDNFLPELESVRQPAMNHGAYQPDNVSKYPGLRSILPNDYIISSIGPLLPHIYKIFRIPEYLSPRPRGYYSLVTQQETQLSPWQTIPHFDNTSPFMIAFIHYLNVGSFGGTGFFRHRATGYDYIDEERKDVFLNSMSHYLSNTSDPAKYCGNNHPVFELYHSEAYEVNRAILFRGHMLHTALINPDTDISHDPSTGRLTANIFIHFK